MYSILLRPLFLLSAETAHLFTMKMMRFLLYIPGVKLVLKSIYRNNNPINFLGLQFRNRVGMAAGFDKNAMPFGLQIIGKKFDAAGLLKMGNEISLT